MSKFAIDKKMWWTIGVNQMYPFIKDQERKKYLFNVVCCEEVIKFIREIHKSVCKDIIITLELYADGLIGHDVLEDYGDELSAYSFEWTGLNYASYSVFQYSTADLFSSVYKQAENAHYHHFQRMEDEGKLDDHELQVFFYDFQSMMANKFRRIFNPFYELTFEPSRQAVEMASLIYKNKDWGILPILADMVEEDGADPTILEELRKTEFHMRGMWCLDLIAGMPSEIPQENQND